MDEYRLKVGVSVPIFSTIKKVSEREIIMKKIANLIKVVLKVSKFNNKLKKEREIIMKKVLFMLVMMFTMNLNLFAEDNNATEVKKYEMNVNVDKLGNYLELSIDQMDAVESITNEFENDLIFAAVECNDYNRKAVTKNAINKNVKNMRYVLTEEQMKKYLSVLNATVHNRKLQ